MTEEGRPGTAGPDGAARTPQGTPAGFPSVGGGSPTPPIRRAAVPLALAGVAVLAVVAIGLWLLLPRGVEPGATATPRPTMVTEASPSAARAPTATAPGASDPLPSGTADPKPSRTADPASSGDLPIDPAVEARIREITEQVPPIRGLEPLEAVPFRFITPERFEVELRELFAAENAPEQVAAEDDLLKRLGLLAPEAELEALVLELYGSQVAAFYDTRTGSFTVIQRGEDAEFGSADAVTVAHEYVHALQDQHFDLEGTAVADPAEGDRASGALGLIEGDAVAVMVEWAFANLSFDEILELQEAITPGDQELLESMPPVLRRQLEFPYTDGFVFVTAVRAGGDYQAVDEAYAERPVSTEQIMHPEKYLAGEDPVVVELPDMASALGEGWTESYQQTFGEMLIGVLVADGESAPLPTVPGLLPPLPNAEAAAGWGGDRLISLNGPDGAWAVVWQTAWDSDADAGEFSAAAEAAMDDLAFPHQIDASSAVTGLDDPMLVLVASDAAILETVRAALPVE
ncbi:MAG: hypothetical protein H0X59_09055 [Chloroflexi bacterium]|nr:hypothetical protein [Chloroflexota bacterium]